MATERGYTPHKEQLRGRLARIEGQVRGVSAMVDEDRDCMEVLTQVAAARAALDRVSLELLDGHVRGCIGAEDRAEELMGAVGRLVKR